MHELSTDILIVGGGVGGCAAAMAATDLGCSVVITEPTAWLGGQLTSQAVPPDEHGWIERAGCTRRYRRFRDSVRAYYKAHYPLTLQAINDPHLNPGRGMVSNLCHEPRVALAVIEQMLAFAGSSGRLLVLTRHEPVTADTAGDHIRSVTLRNLDDDSDITIKADMVLDATELGDLLALAGVEYVSGAESQDDTGEPHAPTGPAQPDNVQALTWCLPLAYDPQPGAQHVIGRPAGYEHWCDDVPQMTPPWTGPLLSWDAIHPVTLAARRFELLGDPARGDFSSLWHYRRIVAADHYLPTDRPHEVTLLNWPQNDYFAGNIIDKPADFVRRYLREARQLSLSLVYWLQTEAPRPDGATGYPGLYLCPQLVGTTDGLAQAPYIRESRRIKAVFRITENHVGAEARQGAPAETFLDSVGIGYYRIDLHPSTQGDNYIDIASSPFQIPLGSLLPVRMSNLLPACKNIGVTHITNGCYRLHPVEWNIGESAGLLAAFCLAERAVPHQVRVDARCLQSFQDLLRRQGIELQWPESIVSEHQQASIAANR
ncbi:MAG: FAD-dependent oxidoreductase [Phycisphaeraceae bacterium]|nr:FAD-dependent oxidoreductase [Phycisphaeraceae bacterium]